MQNRALEQYLERHLHRHSAGPGEARPDDLDCPGRVRWDRRRRAHPAAVAVVVVMISVRMYVDGWVCRSTTTRVPWSTIRSRFSETTCSLRDTQTDADSMKGI